MSTKAKPNAALAALAKVQVLQPSQTPLAALLPTATPEKLTRARAPETLLSKPTALNLYPDDQDKIEETITYLRSKGCQGVSKSRVAQLAIRELKLNEQTVATFLKLPDYRDKKTL